MSGRGILKLGLAIVIIGWLAVGWIFFTQADFEDKSCYNCPPGVFPDMVELKLEKMDHTITVFFAPEYAPQESDWLAVLRKINYAVVKNNRLQGGITLARNGDRCATLNYELDPRDLYKKLAHDYAVRCVNSDFSAKEPPPSSPNFIKKYK